MCDICQSLKNPPFLIYDVIITGAYFNVMESYTETDTSSIVSTPNATPTIEVENQPVSQSLLESLNEGGLKFNLS